MFVGLRIRGGVKEIGPYEIAWTQLLLRFEHELFHTENLKHCLLASSCRFLFFCFFCDEATQTMLEWSSRELNAFIFIEDIYLVSCCAAGPCRIHMSTKFTEQYSNYKSSLSRLASHMKAWFVFQNQYLKAGAWNIWFRGTSHNLTSWSLGDPAPWLNRLSF
jgi:hypothetical protein